MTQPLRGPLASPGYRLHIAALAWRRELGVRLRPLGLTPTQFDALATVSFLGRTGEPTQQQIADFSGVDRMMLSKVLAGLEKRGLVARTADPADARRKRLVVTPAGRQLVDGATAIARGVDRDLFAAVESPERLREELRALSER
ncbi:MAG: MarR family transcriptional regulator [Pseudolysinimonas sp.]